MTDSTEISSWMKFHFFPRIAVLYFFGLLVYLFIFLIAIITAELRLVHFFIIIVLSVPCKILILSKYGFYFNF